MFRRSAALLAAISALAAAASFASPVPGRAAGVTAVARDGGTAVVELTSEPYAAEPGRRVTHTIVVRGAGDGTSVVFTSSAPLDGIRAPGGRCAVEGGGVRCVFRTDGDSGEFTVAGVVGTPSDALVRNAARVGDATSVNGYLASVPARADEAVPEASAVAVRPADHRPSGSPTRWSGLVAAALAVLWAALAVYAGRRGGQRRLMFGVPAVGGRS